MSLYHPENHEPLLHEMEDSGFGTLEPAIRTEDLKNLCEGDPVLQKSYEQMITYCTRYAHDVFSMMHEQK